MNKFRAKPVVIDGIRFASQREGKRYSELKLLARAGDISGLILQPKFWLEINGKPILLKSVGFPNGRRASFKPDFQYLDKAGTTILEDVKSPASRTEAYVLRKGVFECLFPHLELREL